MAHRFGHAPAARRWALGAAALTTVLAALDAALSGAILTGILVLGPLLAAARSGPRTTARWRATRGARVRRGPLERQLPRRRALHAPVRARDRREPRRLDRRAARAGRAHERPPARPERARGDARRVALARRRDAEGARVDRPHARLAARHALAVDESGQALLRVVDVWQEPGLQAAGFVGLSRRTTFARGEGLPGQAWERNEPVWAEDVSHDANYTRAEVARDAGLSAALAFPVLGEHGVARSGRVLHARAANSASGAAAAAARVRQPARPVHRAEAGRGGRARERGRQDLDLRDRARRRDHRSTRSGNVVEFNPSAERDVRLPARGRARARRWPR